jgi:dolichol-phosphate mannosyltransferase
MSNQVTSESAVVAPPVVTGAPRARAHVRVKEGMAEPHNWIQLLKFGIVGASGYVINLIAFTVFNEKLGVYYLLASVIAFCFAVTNNFLWNRYWTFKASDGHAGFQAARFLVVSLIALGFNLVFLRVLVEAGMSEFNAQAIAVILATPLNFIGNKLWSFRL